MSDDRAPEEPGAFDHRQSPGATLAVGDRIGPYLITAVELDPVAEATYWARGVDDEPTPPTGEPQRVYFVRERARAAYGYARPVAALGLKHANVLAPVAVITQADSDYLVTQALTADAPGTGARLSAEAALAAGVALADALTFLHGVGVAHLRVSPDVIVVNEGTAYLTGLEDAQLIHPLDPNAAALFARDAVFLAHTLGALAGVSEDDATSGNAPRATLASLVAHAGAGEFTTAAQVGAVCAEALERPTPAPSQRASAAAARDASPASEGPVEFALAAASATSIGMVREENQDASSIVQFDLRDDATQSAGANPGGLYLVADGMGGEERGELASRIATRVVVAEVWRGLTLPLLHTPVEMAEAADTHAGIELPSLSEVLAQAGRTANSRIRTLGGRLGKITGTTLTALLVVGGHASLVHVGDSRAYLLRDGTFKQLTSDHTLLARLKASDNPLLDDPMFALPRNLLFRSLGQADEVDLDVIDVPLAVGDRVLLCSDGLWDELVDGRISAILGSATEPRGAAHALVAAADAAGGKDNSTAVVIFVERGA
jgi:PPM family protein phosphatase